MQQLISIQDCHPLFEDVQLKPVFADSKTFVDCVPRFPLAQINNDYLAQKALPDFSLDKFVMDNFELPHIFGSNYQSNPSRSAAEHINDLWPVLTRSAVKNGGSLLALPKEYIVPGGRFGEVYYWDSYFTMIGLKASGLNDMVENMVENFAHLIKIIGFIPNGNRTYYLGRSQPPFFSLMIKLLAEIKGPQVLANYLLPLQKEYDYWVRGKEKLTESNRCVQHSVRLSEEVQLSRYYDAYNTPRPESYREDVELLHTSVQLPTQLYQHLRAGAESGWDYSSRWFKDGLHFSSIHTADIIPVDLNCLLYHHEITLAQTYQNCLHYSMSAYYKSLAHKRREAILQYCWNSNAGFFVDYDFVGQKQKQELTLAGITPLYFNIAEQYQADRVAEKLTNDFLKPGGLVTTLKTTGQQWDAPNGWAPLQWLAIIGLENYGHHALAKTIAQRWLALNENVYANTGKMMEKYNVVDVNQEAGGGEYPGQDGFGWTNGVYLELLKRYGHP